MVGEFNLYLSNVTNLCVNVVNYHKLFCRQKHISFVIIKAFWYKQGRKSPLDMPERKIKDTVITETHCDDGNVMTET